MTTFKLKTWSCALLLLTAACGGREGDFDQSLLLKSNAVGIGHSLVMMTESSGKAIVLDLAKLEDVPKVIDLPSNPSLLQKRNDADEALVLCLGKRGTAAEDAEPSVLGVITPGATMRQYTLGSPFDAL